jgi:hypothetical protein
MARAAAEQARTEFFLESANRGGKCGLDDMHASRGAGEILFFCDGDEMIQLP